MAIDLDAILKENEQPGSVVKLRGKQWRFQRLSNLKVRLFTEDIDGNLDELNRLAVMLSDSVDPKQRKAFSELELTVREAKALWDALVQDQQGVTPGESEASPQSS